MPKQKSEIFDNVEESEEETPEPPPAPEPIGREA